MDFEDERELLVREMLAAARVLSRLTDLVGVLEHDCRPSVELDGTAEALQQWARSIAVNLFRPGLIEDVERNQQELARWHALKTGFAT